MVLISNTIVSELEEVHGRAGAGAGAGAGVTKSSESEVEVVASVSWHAGSHGPEHPSPGHHVSAAAEDGAVPLQAGHAARGAGDPDNSNNTTTTTTHAVATSAHRIPIWRSVNNRKM